MGGLPHHRWNTALCLTVINRFDIIAIRIEDKGGVVAGMIITLTGRAVIFAAVGQRGLIKAIHHGAIFCLKGEMVATSQDPQRGGAPRCQNSCRLI